MRMLSVARAASARSTASTWICSANSASGSSVAASALASGASFARTWLVSPALDKKQSEPSARHVQRHTQ